MVLVACVAIAGVNTVAESNTTLAAQAAKYSLPPPFTPNVFWGNVVELLARTHGHVTHELFAQVFGVRLNAGAKHEDGRSYGLEAGRDWYISTYLQENTRKFIGSSAADSGLSSSFSMQWPENAFGDPLRHDCVRAGDALEDLRRTGWKVTTKPIAALTRDAMSDELAMGHSLLYLYHYNYPGPIRDDNESCVTRIVVNGRL